MCDRDFSVPKAGKSHKDERFRVEPEGLDIQKHKLLLVKEAQKGKGNRVRSGEPAGNVMDEGGYVPPLQGLKDSFGLPSPARVT
jgi:hypothetical protein